MTQEETTKELQKLVEDAQNGEKEAFKEIFDGTSNRLFAYALSHTQNRDDAMDIVQDTFIDLWKALKKFKYSSDQEFYGFVFLVLKRKLAKYYKSKPKTVELDEQTMGGTYDLEYEDYRYLMKSVGSLSAKYQDVLKLRYWSDMTFAEISSILNVKEATAKVWHHRALQKLKITYMQNNES